MRAASAGTGLANTDHPDGLGAFQRRWSLLQAASATGPGLPEYYEQARAFVSNPDVTAAFSYTQEEWMRYGGTQFGGALLTARKIIEQDLGTASFKWGRFLGIITMVFTRLTRNKSTVCRKEC